MKTVIKHSKFDIILFRNKVCIVKKAGAKGEVLTWSDDHKSIRMFKNVNLDEQSFEHRERTNLHPKLRELYDRETMTISKGKYVTFKTEEHGQLQGCVIRGGRKAIVLIDDGVSEYKVGASNLIEIEAPVIDIPEELKKWSVKNFKHGINKLESFSSFSADLYKDLGPNKRPLKVGYYSNSGDGAQMTSHTYCVESAREFEADVKKVCEARGLESIESDELVLLWLGMDLPLYITIEKSVGLDTK
ncbi:hypothetical protein [Vibrio splendidus]|uniref:hypothetical protein n=1 Tax=Vibrio splendidus TaxID=29497 RepID=UPI003D119413